MEKSYIIHIMPDNPQTASNNKSTTSIPKMTTQILQ